MISFLEINGIKLSYTDEELVEVGLKFANGSIDEKGLLNFVVSRS